LASKLLRKGLKTKVSWLRGTHTFASGLARLLDRSNVFKGLNNPYYGINIPLRLRKIWQIIEFISVLPVVFFKFVLPDALGFIVVADRYALDFLVWVSLTTDDTSYLKSFETRFFLALVSKIRVKIYVTASFEELSNRKKDDVNNEFLSNQLMLYEKLASVMNAHKLDTSFKSIDESLGEILNILENYELCDFT